MRDCKERMHELLKRAAYLTFELRSSESVSERGRFLAVA